jgi:hypothetical protein
VKKARTLFCSTRSQTHSPSESYARWRRLEPLGFARRQRPPCKRDADPSGLKADREGVHVANVLGWLRMRQTKTYWHRKTARSEFRAEPQQPGPACGACPCQKEPSSEIQTGRSVQGRFAGAASCFGPEQPHDMSVKRCKRQLQSRHSLAYRRVSVLRPASSFLYHLAKRDPCLTWKDLTTQERNAKPCDNCCYATYM